MQVKLLAPLAESAITFTINEGAPTVCGSNELCILHLPVECADSAAAAANTTVCRYVIRAVADAAGYVQSHPAVMTFTVADTAAEDAATSNRFEHSVCWLCHYKSA